jgi:hypothetical protein
VTVGDDTTDGTEDIVRDRAEISDRVVSVEPNMYITVNSNRTLSVPWRSTS